MKLSIIIPVYNGKEILFELFRRINETLTGKLDYEVLLICDNCDSISFRIVKEIEEANSSVVKGYYLAQNYGQHRAIQFGFGKASGNLIVTMDEDLQHDPWDILKLIEKQKKGNFDIVYGRFFNLQHNGFRNIISVILRKALKYFIPGLYADYSPYRLLKREIAYRISPMVFPYTFIDDFLSRVTQNIAFEDIIHHKRKIGKSSYTFRKLITHGIYILLAYSKLITYLLVLSGVFVVTGLVLFVLDVTSSENLNIGSSNRDTIFVTITTGVIFIILSLIGSYINSKNSRINTRPIKLLNEDSF